jgi:hypothetical protein
VIRNETIYQMQTGKIGKSEPSQPSPANWSDSRSSQIGAAPSIRISITSCCIRAAAGTIFVPGLPSDGAATGLRKTHDIQAAVFRGDGIASDINPPGGYRDYAICSLNWDKPAHSAAWINHLRDEALKAIDPVPTPDQAASESPTPLLVADIPTADLPEIFITNRYYIVAQNDKKIYKPGFPTFAEAMTHYRDLPNNRLNLSAWEGYNLVGSIQRHASHLDFEIATLESLEGERESPPPDLTPAAVDTLKALADQESNPESFAAQAAAIITEDLAATDGLPGFIDHIDKVTGEVTRIPVDVKLEATEPNNYHPLAQAAVEPATEPTTSAEPNIIENPPTSAPDWSAMIDVNKFYGIDTHERKVFTHGYAQQFQANMAYPHAPGQTNLRILIGSKLLAFLMPGQMYDHFTPYPPIAAPAPVAPAIPFDFDPLGVYLYNPLDKQLYTDCFPNEITARSDERTDARWYPETGAIIVRNWQRRFADYRLMTLAERTAQTAPLASINEAISTLYRHAAQRLGSAQCGRGQCQSAAVDPDRPERQQRLSLRRLHHRRNRRARAPPEQPDRSGVGAAVHVPGLIQFHDESRIK